MKRLGLIFFFIAFAITAYSQATSGTRVTAPIVPNDSADVYPTHDAFFGRDGYRSVNDTIERNLIKPGLRKEGMLVWVKSDSTTYQLKNGTTNTHWIIFSAILPNTFHPYKGASNLNLDVDTLELRGKVKINDSTVIYLPQPQTSAGFLGSIIFGNGGRFLSHVSSTQGQFNTFLGFNTGYNITTGAGNVAIGYDALTANTTTSGNTAIGWKSLKYATGGSNTAIGGNTLQALTTGTNNVAIGVNSSFYMTTGISNVGVGNHSLWQTTTGQNNIAIGRAALYQNTTGNSNTVIGLRAGLNNTIGSFNTYIGDSSSYLNNSGNYNITIGYFAGSQNTTSYRGYIEPSNSQTPLIGLKFDEDKVGINKLITAPLDSTLNIGGGLSVDRGAYIGLNISAQRFFTRAISDTTSSTDLQLMPKRWILDRLSNVRLTNNILEWDTINHYYRPYDSYSEIGANAYLYKYANRPSGTDTAKFNGYLITRNLFTNNNDNLAYGKDALSDLTNGVNNVAIGNEALRDNISGSNNTAIGTNSMRFTTTGANNTLIGYETQTNGNSNVLIGTSSFNGAVDNNVAIGSNIGTNVYGSGNVLIGYRVASTGSTTPIDNRLYIANSNTTSPLIYGEFDNLLIRVNGNVQTRHLIGLTASPSVITGTGAGTGASVTITGTDAAGRIVLTSGTTPTAGTLVVQTTFNINYGSAPNVVLTPGNFAAAAYASWYIATFTNMFTLYGTGALDEATEYIWFYHVIQ